MSWRNLSSHVEEGTVDSLDSRHLAGAGSAQGLVPVSSRLPSSRFCSGCGRTLAQLRRFSTAGCGICYEAFRDVWRAGILQLQGTTVHSRSPQMGGPAEPAPLARKPFAGEPAYAASLPCGGDWLESLFGLDRLDWLAGQGGPEADIVISSRLRLARNLSRYNFPSVASRESSRAVRIQTVAATQALLPNWVAVGLSELSTAQTGLLRERRLLPADSALHRPANGQDCERELIAPGGAAFSILVNEEDHLRLQSLQRGLSLTTSLSVLMETAAELESVLGFATSPELGYLTTCPSNLGTGLRASTLLHLPALAWFQALPEVASKVARVGELTLRGLHGEESLPQAAFLQLSNQVTLGRSEDELLEKVQSVTASLVSWERRARAKLLDSHRLEVEDTVWRAWGTLSHARLMSHDEALEALGLLRLGVLLGFLPERNVVRLLVACGDAHVEWRSGATLSAQETDSLRAAFLREAIP